MKAYFSISSRNMKKSRIENEKLELESKKKAVQRKSCRGIMFHSWPSVSNIQGPA